MPDILVIYDIPKKSSLYKDFDLALLMDLGTTVTQCGYHNVEVVSTTNLSNHLAETKNNYTTIVLLGHVVPGFFSGSGLTASEYKQALYEGLSVYKYNKVDELNLSAFEIITCHGVDCDEGGHSMTRATYQALHELKIKNVVITGYQYPTVSTDKALVSQSRIPELIPCVDEHSASYIGTWQDILHQFVDKLQPTPGVNKLTRINEWAKGKKLQENMSKLVHEYLDSLLQTGAIETKPDEIFGVVEKVKKHFLIIAKCYALNEYHNIKNLAVFTNHMNDVFFRKLHEIFNPTNPQTGPDALFTIPKGRHRINSSSRKYPTLKLVKAQDSVTLNRLQNLSYYLDSSTDYKALLGYLNYASVALQCGHHKIQIMANKMVDIALNKLEAAIVNIQRFSKNKRNYDFNSFNSIIKNLSSLKPAPIALIGRCLRCYNAYLDMHYRAFGNLTLTKSTLRMAHDVRWKRLPIAINKNNLDYAINNACHYTNDLDEILSDVNEYLKKTAKRQMKSCNGHIISHDLLKTCCGLSLNIPELLLEKYTEIYKGLSIEDKIIFLCKLSKVAKSAQIIKYVNNLYGEIPVTIINGKKSNTKTAIKCIGRILLDDNLDRIRAQELLQIILQKQTLKKSSSKCYFLIKILNIISAFKAPVTPKTKQYMGKILNQVIKYLSENINKLDKYALFALRNLKLSNHMYSNSQRARVRQLTKDYRIKISSDFTSSKVRNIADFKGTIYLINELFNNNEKKNGTKLYRNFIENK